MNKKFNSIRYKIPFVIDHFDRLRVYQVLEWIGKNHKILDLGCGDGFLMEVFSRAGNTVEGVEVASSAIKSARSKNFTVHDCSLSEDWSRKIKSRYDIVFAGEIIEHIFDTDKFLINCRNVLKRGGLLIITTPNIASLGRRLMLLFGVSPIIESHARVGDAGHVRYFTGNSLKQLLLENNFHILEMKSSVVNFSQTGNFRSEFLAKVFPALGNNILLKAVKK